jgi:hypothetical protein
LRCSIINHIYFLLEFKILVKLSSQRKQQLRQILLRNLLESPKNKRTNYITIQKLIFNLLVYKSDCFLTYIMQVFTMNDQLSKRE